MKITQISIKRKTTTTLSLVILALGFFALPHSTQAVSPPPDGGYPGGNTAEGTSALLSRTTGLYNTAVGIYSILSLTDGNFCTGVGAGTLLANTANENTATGAGALLSNTTGVNNTANGAFALFNNTEGSFNTAVGDNALFSNTTGIDNTANGYQALNHNTTGSENTASGFAALFNNTTGNFNTAYGSRAGLSITGDGNVCIGAAISGVPGENDTTWIRNINTTAQNFVAGTNNYVTVRMSDGRIGYTAVVSSRRYKEDIKPMDKASEAILALKPVTFRLKGELDPSHRPQWGLIAEEVEKVNPDLVDRNNKGEVESVRYDQVNAMLLNEFLKEHRKVQAQDCKIQEQEATIIELKSTVAQHQKGMEILTAQIKQQAAQIQKVSAQSEISKPAPQMVLNNP